MLFDLKNSKHAALWAVLAWPRGALSPAKSGLKILFAVFVCVGAAGFVCLLPFFAGRAFAQSSLDAVEIETEVGVEQMKPSDRIEKLSIKPRSDYKAPKGAPFGAQKETPDFKPAIGAKAQTSSVQSAAGPDVSNPFSQQTGESLTAPSSLGEEIVKPPVEMITDVEVVRMSESLRKLIEDNSLLKNQIAELDAQLKVVRGQQKLESARASEVVLERDALRKQNENIASLGSETQKRLEALQADLTQKEQDYSLQIVRLQTELAQKLRQDAAQQPLKENSPEKQSAAAVGQPSHSISVDVTSSPVDEQAKERGAKVLLALDQIASEKEKIALDQAKVHYNMGNTYFNQGAYQKAAREYARSLVLSPQDASAHYNLAFVSGEFLHDPRTALEHYKQYLFFNPSAQDEILVRQKIVEAQIAVAGDINFRSGIDKDFQREKNDVHASPLR